MNITLEGNKILKDGEEIGVFNPDSMTVLSPKDIAPTVKGHVTTILMEKYNLPQKPFYDVAPENKPKKDKIKDRKDLMNKRDGDKTPSYMQWYLETHGQEAFDAKYGPMRKCSIDPTEAELGNQTNVAEK